MMGFINSSVAPRLRQVKRTERGGGGGVCIKGTMRTSDAYLNQLSTKPYTQSTIHSNACNLSATRCDTEKL